MARFARSFVVALLLAATAAALAPPPGARAATPSSALSPRLGLRIDGRLWRQHAGTFVSAAGDVNGDGLADVLVGTQESHREGGGLPTPTWNAYVVFGRRGARGAIVRLDRLGSRGLHLIRHGGPIRSGAGAGDVNGDGLDDIVLGGGRTWVVFGRRSAGTIDVDHLGSHGLTLTGTAGGQRGAAVAGAGDLDRDGFADLLVPEPDIQPPGGEFGTGRVLVVFGVRSGGTLDVSHVGPQVSQIIGPGPYSTPTPDGPRLYGAGFGSSVAGVGDTNGDRRPDVIIGAPWLGGREGGAFVILSPGRRAATIDLRKPQSGWYRLSGAGGNAAGWSVATAGDQNGDGLRDVLVGTLSGGDALASSSGPSDAYVIFGQTAPANLQLTALGTAGVVLHDAVSGDRAGQSVASVGNLVGDRAPDLLIGAPLADPRGVSAAGSAFLVPGGSFAATVDIRNQAAGRRYDGAARYDTAGWSVTGLGDVNGDHRNDIAVAAPRTDVLSNESGSVYVVYG